MHPGIVEIVKIQKYRDSAIVGILLYSLGNTLAGEGDRRRATQ